MSLPANRVAAPTDIIPFETYRRAVDAALADVRKQNGDATAMLSGAWLQHLMQNPDMMKPPDAVVDRLAWRGRLTFLAAREKAGKSTLVAAAAAAVTRGQAFFGGPAREPGNVLWVGLEESPADMVQRFLKFGADPARICMVTHLSGLAQLQAEASRPEGFALSVVDTLSALVYHTTGGDENDAAQMTAAIQPVLELARNSTGNSGGTAWILTGHGTKAEGGGYRGSSAIGAQADMIIEMSEASDVSRSFKVRGRWHLPNYTAVLEGHSYRIEGLGTTNAETAQDTRILAYVAAHPGCSWADVRGKVVGNYSVMLKKVQGMIAAGHLVDRGRPGHYELHLPDYAVPAVPACSAKVGTVAVPARLGVPPLGGTPLEQVPSLEQHRGEAWDGDLPEQPQ